MKNLTTAQKIYLGTLLGLVGTWLALELGVAIYEYGHGKSALTALLLQLASILKFSALGVVALAWVLQRTGILPTVRPADPSRAGVNPTSRLRNLAIWIIIALALVFFFNFFHGSDSHPPQKDDLITALVNWFPFLLLVVVWIFFLLRFQAKKKRDLNGNS